VTALHNTKFLEPGLRVVSITQQIDFNGTLGRMLAAVLLGVAKMSRKSAESGRQ
jgi:DNA invertase Pin-like site-specific DNA recombinase